MLIRIANHIKFILNERKDKRIVKWSQNRNTSKNIGDVLCGYLFQKTFQKEAVNIKEVLNIGSPQVYTFGGSVLDNSKVKNLVVIGSGFKREKSLMPLKPKKVISCRGPLTRKKLLEMGVSTPEVYGDPAILCPLYFDPENVQKKYKMGFIPHYVDRNLPLVNEWSKNKEFKFIDIFSGFEDFVTTVKECEFTISSSLHGLIISHAYGIPSVWVDLSAKIAGGEFKFLDYFKSVGIEEIDSVEIVGPPQLELLKKQATLPNLENLRNDLLLALNEIKI